MDGHRGVEGVRIPPHDPHAEAVAYLAAAGGGYLSTACTHGRHDYCRAMVGTQGEKRPATCKFCDARCVCACHEGEQ